MSENTFIKFFKNKAILPAKFTEFQLFSKLRSKMKGCIQIMNFLHELECRAIAPLEHIFNYLNH